MLLTELVLTSQAVAATPRRSVKIAEIADLLRTASPPEVPVVVAFLSGELRQRQIGVGYAALGGLAAGGGAAGGPQPTLTVSEVDGVFAQVGAVTGAGAQATRRRMLAELFGRATDAERDFLIRLIAGELHQGALEGVMIEAVARAAGVPASEVRRAHLLGGSLQAVAEGALTAAKLAAPATAPADPADPAPTPD
ncbi:MAG TPA: ATP-dependent DNA ligase, partial [Streptosporangiaceae bacterium]